LENFEARILPFLENDQFINWVIRPDEESNAFWRKWTEEHPDQLDNLVQAKEFAIHLQEAQKSANAEPLSESIWAKINSQIGPVPEIAPVSRLRNRANYWIAASIAGVLVLGSAVFYRTKIQVNGRKEASPKIAAILKNNILKRLNSTNQNQIAYLVDGTKVTMRPGSSIEYTVFLQQDKRSVNLNGDAFFDVAKDANRPFYVYTKDIVLKVLGTSFNVSNNRKNGNITVLVKTGKVSVSKNSNRNKAEFILTPNQLITYTPQSNRIVKSDLDSGRTRLNETPEANPINFKFDETPVSKIFATLEEGYGIRINFDQQVFSRCNVTTSLTDESFEEKLKIICEAINANYKIADNQVFIDGNGCK
jgi:transmembrane sensor